MKAPITQIKKIALITSTALLITGCGSAPTSRASQSASILTVPSKAGYFPIEIQNNVGPGAATKGVTDVYLLLTGKQLTTPNPECVMSLTSTSVTNYNAWMASCTNVTLNTKINNYSYSIKQLTPNPGKPLLIYIPQVISGRAFVSLNDPMDMPMTRAADGTASIQAPSLSNPSDGNYNLIYDKFEYTYDDKQVFWIDTTSVDDFSLPIALSYTNTAGTQLNGYTNQTRDQIVNGIQNFLTKNGNSNWQALIAKDAFSHTNTVIRVNAPNTSANFNNNYLTALDGYGFNYVNALIQFYSDPSNAIIVNCSEVDSPKYPEYQKLGSGTDPNAYIFKGYVVGKQFIFTNEAAKPQDKMSINIDLSQASSNDFFGPGQAPLDTPDGTVRSVIVKNLTAAFSIGLLPAPGGTTINNLFTSAHTNYYTTNSILKNKYNAYSQTPTGIGPWYDLYAQAIHSLAANHVYAFAYDDVLKQDGTLSIPNSDAGSQEPPVIITFESVGNLTVPSPGPNYTPTPPPNDIQPVTNVKQTGFSCNTTAKTCTLSAKWSIPAYQDTAVKYFILPSPSPVSTSAVLTGQPLLNYGTTQTNITFPFTGTAPKTINQVIVYACIPGGGSKAIGYDCPSSTNSYGIGPQVVGTASQPTGIQLLPVSVTGNSNFSCDGQNCTLIAKWDIPADEPSKTQFYVWPFSNDKPLSQVTFPLVIGGQVVAPESAVALKLPQVNVTTITGKTTVNTKVIVYACINDTTTGMQCPSSSNRYTPIGEVGSSPFP